MRLGGIAGSCSWANPTTMRHATNARPITHEKSSAPMSKAAADGFHSGRRSAVWSLRHQVITRMPKTDTDSGARSAFTITFRSFYQGLENGQPMECGGDLTPPFATSFKSSNRIAFWYWARNFGKACGAMTIQGISPIDAIQWRPLCMQEQRGYAIRHHRASPMHPGDLGLSRSCAAATMAAHNIG